jgi:transposase
MARLLTMDEAKRFAVIQALEAGSLTIEEACRHLAVSRATLWRLRHRAGEEGPSGLAHRSRGISRGPRSSALQAEVCELFQAEYAEHGYGPRHFWDEAQERFSRPVPYSTVWRWLRTEGLVSRSRRAARHRSRRPRKPCFGELVQMDTSIHDWLGTGEKCCLIVAVDDATGRVLGAYFHPTDTVLANMLVVRELMRKHGLPIDLYVDRSPIFKFTRTGYGRVLRANYGPVKTQFERAMEELGVGMIHAFTPQAKGRVERLFGTWQRRLVPELSKRGIKDLEAANAYLRSTFAPGFNRRFGKTPTDEQSAFVPLFDIDLDRILSEHYPRRVTNDHVITCQPAKFKAKILPGNRTSYAKTQVVVHRHIDGEPSIYFGDEKLRYRRLG